MSTLYSTLEFDRFLKLLSNYAATEPAKARLVSLKHTTNLHKARAHFPLLNTFMRLQQRGTKLPHIFFIDQNPVFKKLAISDFILSINELSEVLTFLKASEEMRTAFEHILESSLVASDKERQPLEAFYKEFESSIQLIEALDRAIEPPESLKDSASLELRLIRKEIRNLEKNINRNLNAMLGRPGMEDYLQERYITVRNGRFVIPVRVESKNRVSGIIHDHSDSGRTVFIEPQSTVMAGNELTELKLDEKDECRRILKELTNRLRAETPRLKANYRQLIHYDYCKAIADWALEFQCRLPKFGSDLKLVKARHPLLALQFKKEKCSEKLIPLNLFMPPKQYRTMAVTGSNAGGKTVTLKTVGLLCLMAQAGLPVPVDEGSRFMVYDHILADIGDEQSLEQNLSTFSAHLSKLKLFFQKLKNVNPDRALILLDELGSGTDPIEGGAIACAILKQFNNLKALCVATTHLGTVKTFVSEQPNMINAAMLFNTNTFSPEFTLSIGRPGASYALKLAEKIELPNEVISFAESVLDSDHLQLETTLLKLEEDQRTLNRQEKKITEIRQKVSGKEEVLSKQLTEMKAEKKKIMHDAYLEAASIVDNAKKQMEKLLRKAQEENKEKAEVKKVRETLQKKKENLAKSIMQTREKPAKPVQPDVLKIGMKVWVQKLQAKATITEISEKKKRVKVDYNGLPVEVAMNQLGKTSQEPDPVAEQPSRKLSVSRPRVRDISQELSLIGLRIPQAMQTLDRYLDQAMLANLTEIRIVHGFGTGALREAVHDYLRRVGVNAFRDGRQEDGEGGGGCTVVTL